MMEKKRQSKVQVLYHAESKREKRRCNLSIHLEFGNMKIEMSTLTDERQLYFAYGYSGRGYTAIIFKMNDYLFSVIA